MTFKIPSGSQDVAILRAVDYIAEVEKYEGLFREQLRQHPGDKAISSKVNALATFGRALPQLTSLSTAPLKVLVSKMNESEDTADEQEIRAMVGYDLRRLCNL